METLDAYWRYQVRYDNRRGVHQVRGFTKPDGVFYEYLDDTNSIVVMESAFFNNVYYFLASKFKNSFGRELPRIASWEHEFIFPDRIRVFKSGNRPSSHYTVTGKGQLIEGDLTFSEALEVANSWTA